MIQKTSSIYLIVALFTGINIIAQKKTDPEPTFYVDSLNRYYMQAELPIYLTISNSPQTNGTLLSPTDHSDEVNNLTPIYMDGHGKHNIRHMDTNQGKTLDRFVIYADGKAPKTLLIANSVPKFRNSNDILYYGKGLRFSLKAKDEMSGVKEIFSSLNSNPFKTYNQELVSDKEGDFVLQYYSTDRVGNAEKAKMFKYTVDLTPPKTYYHIVGISKNTIISTSTRLYLTCSDSLSGLANLYYYFDEQDPQRYTFQDLPIAQLDDGHHTLNYYSIDNVNNKSEIEQLKFYLDKTAPIVSADVLGDKFIVGDKVYYSGRSKLKLTAVDNKSGVKDILYTINNGKFKQYTDPFYLPNKTGKHTVRYFARDNVSNDKKFSEYKHVVGIAYVDLTGPSLSFKYNGPSFKKGENTYISTQTSIKLSASDIESGLQRIKYIINGSEEIDYKESVVIEEEGLYKFTVVGYDNVNNRNVRNFEFTIDNTPSDIFVNYSTSPTEVIEDIPIYPSYFSIFLACSDKATECDKILYSINDQPLQIYNNKISGFKKNKDYKIRIVTEDKLMNKSEKTIHFKTNDL